MQTSHPALAGLLEHPLRARLDQEFHARPSQPLHGPLLVSHLAFKNSRKKIAAERDNLAALTQAAGCTVQESSEAHLLLDAGAFRLRWELHTEFSSYTFFRPLSAGEILDKQATAFDAVAHDWLAGIPGKLVVATHVELRSTAEIAPAAVLAEIDPDSRQLGVSRIADGRAWIFTDFRIDDGFSRFLVLDDGLTPRQAGRTMQRVIEIETYRLMALFGLPAAKRVGGWLYDAERELADLMELIGRSSTPEDEREALGKLSRLAAEVERSVATTTFRFGAARAYHDLVRQRVGELREERQAGLPTIEEFMQRRLQPAMATCEAIARRQEELSGRVARNSQLLRTRVDIELERQNQELLGQMNRRAKLQLRLQQTVEGLSVVVLTYYGSQLVQYLAKGTKALHHLDTDLITAVSIPLIAGLVAWGTHRMHKALAAEDDAAH